MCEGGDVKGGGCREGVGWRLGVIKTEVEGGEGRSAAGKWVTEPLT